MRQRQYILDHCPEYDYVEYFIRRNDKNLKSYAAFTDPVMWNRDLFELKEWDAFYLSETPDTCSMSWGAAEPRTALWCRFVHKPSKKEFIFINAQSSSIKERISFSKRSLRIRRGTSTRVSSRPMVYSTRIPFLMLLTLICRR